MTRKHFEAIAKMLRAAREDMEMARGKHMLLCYMFADWLRGENPNFDKARFLKACGMEF